MLFLHGVKSASCSRGGGILLLPLVVLIFPFFFCVHVFVPVGWTGVRVFQPGGDKGELLPNQGGVQRQPGIVVGVGR